MRRLAEQALARLGLQLDVTRPLASCSMAIQQMVAIARALDIQGEGADPGRAHLQPRRAGSGIPCLDPPASKRARKALLFVTRFLDQVYAVSDFITVLRNGKFVGEYPGLQASDSAH